MYFLHMLLAFNKSKVCDMKTTNEELNIAIMIINCKIVSTIAAIVNHKFCG